MKIRYASKFRSQIKRAPKHVKEKVLRLVDELSRDPLPEGWDIGKIKGENNVYRVRIGNWRLIYLVEEDEVRLVSLRSRGRIY